MSELRRGGVVLLVLALVVGCAIPPRCASKAIGGAKHFSNSTIQWGDTSRPVLSAEIGQVLVECLPVEHPAITTEGTSIEAFRDFELKVSVWIDYRVPDQSRFRESFPQGYVGTQLRTEVIAPRGAVLDSREHYVTLPGGTNMQIATLSVSGLSAEMVRKTSAVRVSWTYQ